MQVSIKNQLKKEKKKAINNIGREENKTEFNQIE